MTKTTKLAKKDFFNAQIEKLENQKSKLYDKVDSVNNRINSYIKKIEELEAKKDIKLVRAEKKAEKARLAYEAAMKALEELDS